MLSKNSYGSFDERPEYKAKQFFFRLTFLIPKILECLLHRLAQLLLKGLWIKSKELPVEFMNYFLFIDHMQTSWGTASVVGQS